MGIEQFTQLDVWKIAHDIVLDVYKFTSTLPIEEKYGIVSQMRRAAVSIPANIAEGFKRRCRNDKAHFYNIAQSSSDELKYYFILVRDLGFEIDIDDFNERIDKMGRMLSNLIKSVKSR
jgi:four helix bundle protein